MGISEGSAKGHCADGGSAVHEFIVSSDLDFGDVVANHCDPEFSLVASGGMDSLPSRVYRLVAYALFANRLIIPSRYLLQPCMTYDALVALRGLLEAGVVVPDLREGHYSFVEYLKEEGVVDKTRFGCAEFLDRYASSVYSFDIKGQSELFHRRVLEDLSEGGLLRSKLRLAGVRDLKIDALRDAFTECEGGRRSLVNLASKYVPHNEGAISKWAALRYYTTPAELMPRCIRDFPASISAELRESHLSMPLTVSDPDEFGNLPQPMELCHRVLVGLPKNLGREELALLSDAVLYVREQVPKGAAKFACLAERNFAENLGEINQALSDALQRERRFSSLTHGFVVEALEGEIPLPIISWCLGYSFGNLDGAVAGVAVSFVLNKIRECAAKRVTPFLETSERLDLKTRGMFKSR